MKKVLLAVFLFIPIFFLLPNRVRATSCTSLTPPGQCETAAGCSQGTPLNGSCGILQVCCPILTTPCTSLTPPGECDAAASCSQGVQSNGSCPTGEICCPIVTASCTSLGGQCETAAGCSQGTRMNGKCGIAQVCCPATGTTTTSTSVTCKPTGGTADTGIQTAIGCIPVLSGTNDFLSFILRWAVGIGGGIAFLLMIYAGFEIMTAAGNPERLKAGQELLTSAISGLILLIFSVFILKFIGVDILGLCNFGFNVGSCPK